MPAEMLDMAALGIGRTPLIDLSPLLSRGSLLLKAEFRNPFGSVKDRTAVYLLNWAYAAAGREVRVVESTSGNLGVALAGIGRLLRFRPIIIVDITVSQRQRDRIAAAGAEIELVRQARPGRDMRQTRIALATELGNRDGYIWLNQYGNDAGMRAHRETTGPEIWTGAGGQVDAIVAPVSTGGTICGIGSYVKAMDPAVRIVGVEPVGSNIFGGDYEPSFLIAGAGMRGPCQLTVEHAGVIDACAKVPDLTSAAYAAHLRDRAGLPVGLSTGAAVSVAMELAEREGIRVVAIAPDTSVGFSAEIDALAASAGPARQLPPAVISPAAGIDWAEIFERENAS